MVLILYGPPGSGKNYVAEWLSSNYGFYFYDADLRLTSEMKQCLYQKQPFTQAMRDAFFTQIIYDMKQLITRHERLVMAQALSQKINRKQVQESFPDATFIHINTSHSIRLNRLAQRKNLVSPDWVEKLLSIQQEANKEHYKIDNSKDNEYISLQFVPILQKLLEK